MGNITWNRIFFFNMLQQELCIKFLRKQEKLVEQMVHGYYMRVLEKVIQYPTVGIFSDTCCIFSYFFSYHWEIKISKSYYFYTYSITS